MPPKPIAPVKGQSSLFSFFKKPATPSNGSVSTTPAPAAQKEEKMEAAVKPCTPTYAITDIVSKESLVTDSAKKAMGFDLSTDMDVAKEPSSPVVVKKKVAPKPNTTNKRPKTVIHDDEDEWDEADNKGGDEESGDSSESASITESESESESDDLEDTDESEDDSAARKRKRPPARRPATAPTAGAKKSLPPRPKASSSASAATITPPSSMSTPMKSSGGLGNRMLVTPDSTAASAHSSFFTPRAGAESPSNDSVTPSASAGMPEGVLEQGQHEHNFFPHLLPKNRKDKRGRPMNHPEYDARTLYVPDAFLREQTPAMAQWWQLKSMHMDTVLFFKVGKFYELFHMDSDIGFTELDLIYMKGTKAHSGFPEIAYGKFCSILVSKGYRVARVEQTETPEQMKERNDSAGKGKKDKVVSRELCSVMSRGTRTYCHLDDLSLLDSAESDRLSSSILVCIKESRTTTNNADASVSSAAHVGGGDAHVVSQDPEELNTLSEYGVCVVDTVIGTITLAQFQDDKQRSRLRTMLARYSPSEVLLEVGQHSARTVGVVKLMAPRAASDLLRSGSEMPTARTALQWLQEGQYFGRVADTSDLTVYPPVLRAVIEGLSNTGSNTTTDAVGGSDLVMAALGGALWQLRRSIIDYEIFSLGKVFAYIPPDELSQLTPHSDSTQASDVNVLTPPPSTSTTASSSAALFASVHAEHLDLTQQANTTSGLEAAASAADSSEIFSDEPKSMTLDEVALTNLEVLTNNYDRTEQGSLWSFVNKCKTAFGRRLLRSWLCHPLFRVSDIQKRAAAVEELLTDLSDKIQQSRGILKNVPDLERLLVRVHSIGISRKGIDHPDCRAVMYEGATYNSRKIRDFADVLTGFEGVLKIGKLFQSVEVHSSLLKICLKSSSASNRLGKFPLEEMTKLLTHFREIFDEQQAKRDGNIKPRAGIDPSYDQAKADVARLEGEFEEYLREVKRSTGISDLKYFGSNKDRYQIEVAMSNCNRVPKDWTTKSQKKTHRRYWTATIERKLNELIAAEEKLASAQGDTLRRIFEKFDQSRAVWSDAVSCISLLDALQSLALISSLPNYTWPRVVSKAQAGGGPQLHIVGGRHPMLEFALSQRGEGEYIPNDLCLGGVQGAEFTPRMLLLSGPNMGGKSTLLRQTCLITILAQLGCKVPASECVLTPVDRIFTRVGASDRILAGQSTFFVELAETATILNAATQDSLCILDELGRGTATFDGTAIAHAVVDHLVRATRCRSLFATHYHSLVDDWEIDPRVKLGHMDCIVDTNRSNTEEVTFLYKLCDGSSPRSYGINVARLAGLPAGVIDLAIRQSKEFEERMKAKVVHSAMDVSEMTHSQVTVGIADILNRDKMASYFEKLVSIANSEIPLNELVYLATEMWQRYKSVA